MSYLEYRLGSEVWVVDVGLYLLDGLWGNVVFVIGEEAVEELAWILELSLAWFPVVVKLLARLSHTWRNKYVTKDEKKTWVSKRTEKTRNNPMAHTGNTTGCWDIQTLCVDILIHGRVTYFIH